MPAELEIRGLQARVGDFTLEAELDVAHDERLVIQAASGTGKTSLLRLIAGLDPLERGAIRLGGRDITAVAPPRRDIGVVFQDPALFDSMTVAENAAFGLRMRGMGKRERMAQALDWLGRVGLGARAGERVTHLSGGEKQRVAFVRALIWRPKLMLLDEPFSALDPAMRGQLRQLLLDLLAPAPVPLILVTHDREDADAVATVRRTIRVLGDGRRVVE
jgi:ABC-type Fe3+/spermidine/putrescine transport system ATPase subunit